MAAPLFKIKDIVDKHKVIVLSSNYSLYGDMSARVMRLLFEFEPNTEVYSIDEAFLDITEVPRNKLVEYGVSLRKHILKCLGIPVSIGISHTKTLAKVANNFAKKNEEGVYIMLGATETIQGLKNTFVKDIWGIGRQYAKNLISHGIETGFDLCTMEEGMLKSFNVTFRRTVSELQGFSCLSLEEIQNKKSLTCSRSFGRSVVSLQDLEEAISTYGAKACEKLRSEDGVVESVYVFVQTDRFKDKFYHYGSEVSLPYATSDSNIIISKAKACIKKLFKQGREYKKAGIILMNIQRQSQVQMSFYTNVVGDATKDALMNVMDRLNQNIGSRTVYFAAEGIARPWQVRRGNVSPNYTTKWSDLPVVR